MIARMPFSLPTSTRPWTHGQPKHGLNTLVSARWRGEHAEGLVAEEPADQPSTSAYQLSTIRFECYVSSSA